MGDTVGCESPSSQEVCCDLPSSTAQGLPPFPWGHCCWLGVLSPSCLSRSLKRCRYCNFSVIQYSTHLFHCPETSIHSIDTSFCKLYAPTILAKSPVEYIKDMSLCGSLFHDDCKNGAVSSVFTNFYIDHAEPLEALHKYNKGRGWVLGALVDGHEFFVLLPTRAIL